MKPADVDAEILRFLFWAEDLHYVWECWKDVDSRFRVHLWISLAISSVI